MKPALWQALGLVLAGVFGWLTLRQIDGAALAAALRGISAGWIPVGLGFLALGYFCRIQRWRRMLRPHNPDLGLARCAVALVASIAVNNLLPFRAGDVMRCFAFSRWLAVPPGPVMASVLAERLFDLVVLVLGLALALWAFSLGTEAMQAMRYGGIILCVLGAVALVLLIAPRLMAPLMALPVAVAGLAGADLRNRTRAATEALLDTLVHFSGRRAMGALLGWTVLVWLFEGATYWAIALAVPALPVPQAAWLAMPMGTLSTLLPSTPGHIGTFDYFAQWAVVAVDNPLPAATAFVLIVHVTLWAATTLIGGLCLAIWSRAGGRDGTEGRAGAGDMGR